MGCVSGNVGWVCQFSEFKKSQQQVQLPIWLQSLGPQTETGNNFRLKNALGKYFGSGVKFLVRGEIGTNE